MEYIKYSNFNDYLRRNLDAKPIQKTIQIPIAPPREPIHKFAKELITKSIVADSRDRDTKRFPKSNRFEVKGENTSQSRNYQMSTDSSGNPVITRSEKPFVDVGARLEFNIKNVREIKLEDCVIPNFTPFHPYLIMNIPELQDIIHGTNDALRNAFAILIPERQYGYDTSITRPSDPVLNVDGDIEYTSTENITAPAWVNCKTPALYCKKIFDPPLANLNNITIEYRTPDGELFDFSAVIPDIASTSGPDVIPDPNNETVAIFNICCERPNKNLLDYDLIT